MRRLVPSPVTYMSSEGSGEGIVEGRLLACGTFGLNYAHGVQEEVKAAAPEGSSPWSMLRQLVRCIQPYLHPSNSGSYTPALSEVLQVARRCFPHALSHNSPQLTLLLCTASGTQC